MLELLLCEDLQCFLNTFGFWTFQDTGILKTQDEHMFFGHIKH